ncbi:leucine-rich repeat and WD repeat-containing protein 1 isoform X2 [Amia ocellicauda]
MAKITETVLLERGSPRTTRLENIKTLNLSKMGLCCADLPVALLSRLRGLTRLNLSGNRLRELPSGLQLPGLRVLDCSHNDLEDVSSLEPLSSLEQLQLDGNLYITVSDNYKVMFLLPNLRILNGKDISSSANHLRYVNTETLKRRVSALWESSFQPLTALTAERRRTVEQEFVTLACAKVKYGPNSLSDYYRWRVEMLARALLHSLVEEREGETLGNSQTDADAGQTHADPSLRSPRKRRGADSGSGPEQETPKKSRQAEVEAAEPTASSPRKSSRLKSVLPQPETPSKSPRKPARADGCPPEPALPCTAPKTPPKSRPAEGPRENGTPRKSSGSTCLEPVHVLQCHSRQDSPEDFSTQLWACAFQPDSDPEPCGSSVVATCGGETVCLIDCQAGTVLKKYKVPGEEFFSLAWSSVLMSREGGTLRQCGMLAAGGRRGVVKLIHPRANCAYGEFRASRRALSALRFSPQRPSFLFTGSYDSRVVLWDIGGVDGNYNFKVSQLMILETGSTPLHLNLPPLSAERHLLAACDRGLLCFDTQLGKNQLKRSSELEVVFPLYREEDNKKNFHTIDGLAFLNNDIIASKSHMQGSIYLWSWSRTLATRPNKRREVGAALLAELQWSGTDLPYLSLSTCPGEGYLVCGDEKGSLWTYHLTEELLGRARAGKPLPPTQVLQWPAPVLRGGGPVDGPSVNSVALAPRMKYLVALTDKNMVVVWRRV